MMIVKAKLKDVSITSLRIYLEQIAPSSILVSIWRSSVVQALNLCPTSSLTCSFLPTVRLNRLPDQVAYISPMDPLRFLLRSAMVYTNKPAMVHQGVTFTYRQFTERVLRLANVLLDDYSVQTGDRVGILCQNIPSFVEATFAIPATGAIMVPFNTRLAAAEIEYVLGHSGCSTVIVQQFFLDSRQVSVEHLAKVFPSLRLIIVADLLQTPHLDPYEVLLAKHTSSRLWKDLPLVNDENAVISINYTSGSTGRPKGVSEWKGNQNRWLWLLTMFWIGYGYLSRCVPECTECGDS